jgi:hypothetical protein
MPTSSELRAAIDAQRIAGDPAGLIGSEKNNGGANVVWLGHALERLDAQREFPSCIGLGKAGHVGRNHAWCHSIDADAAFAQGSCEMLDQGIDGTLGGRISG